MSLVEFLHNAYQQHLSRAERLAGTEADVARRMGVLRTLERESNGNAMVPVLVVRNRDAFVRYCAAYTFSREHGRLPGAPELVDPAMLHLFNHLHSAIEEGRELTKPERVAFLAVANAVFAGVAESFFAVEEPAPAPMPIPRSRMMAFDLAVA